MIDPNADYERKKYKLSKRYKRRGLFIGFGTLLFAGGCFILELIRVTNGCDN